MAIQYATVHKANERFGLFTIAVILAAFIIAFGLMWVHPTLSLVVFFLGLIFTLCAGLAWGMGVRAERRLAKTSLAGHVCPQCGKAIDQDPGTSAEWHCHECGATFSSAGEERTGGAVHTD